MYAEYYLMLVACQKEIDVPALDAVMFLNPKNSIVDIIQSVGRVNA